MPKRRRTLEKSSRSDLKQAKRQPDSVEDGDPDDSNLVDNFSNNSEAGGDDSSHDAADGDSEERPPRQQQPKRSFGTALAAITQSSGAGLLSQHRATAARASKAARQREARAAGETARAQRRLLRERQRVARPLPPSHASERRLARLATRGVVKLFNAVAVQKRALKADKHTRQALQNKNPVVGERLSKEKFLQLLQNTPIS